MITKNFKKILKGFMCIWPTYSDYYRSGSLDNLVSINGTNFPMNNLLAAQFTTYLSGNGNIPFRNSATGYGITIGSGGTAATENDTDLESMIAIGASNVVASRSGYSTLYKEGTKYCVDFDLIFTNKTSTDITIREIGWVNGTTSQNTAANLVLLDRTVLDEPIVLEPNVQTPVKYTLKFDWDI